MQYVQSYESVNMTKENTLTNELKAATRVVLEAHNLYSLRNTYTFFVLLQGSKG